MTSIQEKIIKPKLGLLELAKQLGPISQARTGIDPKCRFEKIGLHKPPY